MTTFFFAGAFCSFLLGYFTFQLALERGKSSYSACSHQSQDTLDLTVLNKILVASVAGFVFSLVDLYSLRSFYDSGITESRYLRMSEGIRGSFAGIAASFLVGFPAMAMAYLFLKKDEIHSSKTNIAIIGIYIFSVGLSFSSGGRNSAAFLITFLMLTGLLRKARKKAAFPALPKSVKISLVLGLAGCLSFSGYLFVAREEMRGRDLLLTLSNLMYYFDLDIKTDYSSGNGPLKIVYFMLVFYITHSVNELNIIINNVDQHMFYGGYNFYKVVLLLNKMGFNLPDITAIVGDMDKTGVYTGLLGALFMDFGFYGTFLFLYFFGLFVSLSWSYAMNTRGIHWELLSIFNLLVILFAPVYSVFNIAYGFSFLISICCIFLFRRRVVL